MTPKQRQLATIRHEPADRISLDAICIENVPQVAELLGCAEAEVHDRLGIDGRVVAAGYTGQGPVGDDGRPLDEWHSDAWLDYGLAHSYPLAGVSSVAEVERFPFPDPALYDYAAAAAAAKALTARYAVRGPYWFPIFCRVCEMMGMEEAMMKMAAEPAVFEAAIERVFATVYGYCVGLLDACGDDLDVFCLGDDFATQRGLMVSPDSWRKHVKPRLAKLFALAKSRGKLVWFHSCGDITSVLPDLIDIGMDVWETVQLHALPMSPEQLKRDFGAHITFFGGVNTQHLPFATSEWVRDEVRRCIDVLGRDGGYICGPDHHIKPDVSAENTVALFQTAMEYTTAA